MAPQELTAYEKKRLINIRRNDEKMTALNIHSAVSQLSAATERPSTRNQKLMLQLVLGGHYAGATTSRSFIGSLSLKDAYIGTGTDRALMNTLLSLENKPEEKVGVWVNKEYDAKMEHFDGTLNDSVKGVAQSDSIKIEKKELEECADLWSMNLEKGL
ncbi:conserved hypothetical protein [Ricinus communis]|uniref:Uncharacterized protein n=1 Tax=Ricinus communis TaxID=3988 RepID=B9SC07_RICCO|nr:conserved hypothetical protein [Ricinus communis]